MLELALTCKCSLSIVMHSGRSAAQRQRRRLKLEVVYPTVFRARCDRWRGRCTRPQIRLTPASPQPPYRWIARCSCGCAIRPYARMPPRSLDLAADVTVACGHRVLPQSMGKLNGRILQLLAGSWAEMRQSFASEIIACVELPSGKRVRTRNLLRFIRSLDACANTNTDASRATR